jgi:hypothetical protein
VKLNIISGDLTCPDNLRLDSAKIKVLGTDDC